MRGKRPIIVSMSALLLSAFLMCIGSVQDVAAKGEKPTIAVVFDRGIPSDMEEGAAKSQNEISDYMEKQLVKLLNKKFKAELVGSEKDFNSGDYGHLLKVTVVKYHRGSSAARMLVGFGAGAASLDIHYELADRKGQSLVSKDDGAGTSQHWSRIPNKLNKNIFKEVTNVLNP